MTGHTETDTEFADGTSPLCVQIDGELTHASLKHTSREQACCMIVRRYGAARCASEASIQWGEIGARNALHAGESAHRAIAFGMERVDDFRAMEPSLAAHPLLAIVANIPGTRTDRCHATADGYVADVRHLGSGRIVTVEVRYRD